MTGPASAVKLAVAAGATTADAISAATGLPKHMVLAITDQLARIGELTIDTIGFGCPDGACGSCSSGQDCDASTTTTATLPLRPTRR